ncbi:MAG: ribonuclease E inhibitor RraB, partial [Bacteroidota bacterium]
INCREVGTFTYQCVRRNYIYISDTSEIGIVKRLYEERSAYAVDFFFESDPKWEAYLEFIYPSPEIQAYMMNQRLIALMIQNGDPLTQERQVDHWAYFPDQAKRNVFENYLQQQGFTIDKKWKDKQYDLPFAIRFSKVDIPDLMDFDSQTQALEKKATELKGNYDGWESIVLTEDK